MIDVNKEEKDFMKNIVEGLKIGNTEFLLAVAWITKECRRYHQKFPFVHGLYRMLPLELTQRKDQCPETCAFLQTTKFSTTSMHSFHQKVNGYLTGQWSMQYLLFYVQLHEEAIFFYYWGMRKTINFYEHPSQQCLVRTHMENWKLDSVNGIRWVLWIVCHLRN